MPTKLLNNHTVLILRSLILLSVICSLFIPLSAAWCYYLDNSDDSPLLIRENAPVDTRQNAFTIQDNLHLFAKPDPSAPILLPASANFVAADIIDSNLPIFSLFRNPAGLGRDPFANFLYANLRVKKLLEEYAKIQKRAKMLLVSSYQSGTVDLMTGKSTYLKESGSPESDNKKNDELFRDVNRLQQNLATIETAKNFEVYAIGNNPTSTMDGKNAIGSFHELQIMLNKKNKLRRSIPSRPAGNNISPMHLNYQPQANTSPDHPADHRTNQPSYGGSGEVNLPWILNLPFKLFDFALAHKVLPN